MKRLLLSLTLSLTFLLVVLGTFSLQGAQAQHWGHSEGIRYWWPWPEDPDPGPWSVDGTHQFEYGDVDQSPYTEFEIMYEVWATGVPTVSYLTLEPGLELAPTENFLLVAYIAAPNDLNIKKVYTYTWSKRHHTIWISTTIVTSKTIDFAFYDCDESSMVYEVTIDLATEGTDYRIDFDDSRVAYISMAWEYYRTSWDQGALLTLQQVDGVDIGTAYGDGEYYAYPVVAFPHLEGEATNIAPSGCTGPAAWRRGTGLCRPVLRRAPTIAHVSEPPPPEYVDYRDPSINPYAVPEPPPQPQKAEWYVALWNLFISLLREWGILPGEVGGQTTSGWYQFRVWLDPQSEPTPTPRPTLAP